MKVKNYKEFNDNAEITFSLGEEDFKVKIPIDNKTKEELISDARTAINNSLLKRQNETMQPIVYKEDNNFIKKQFIEIDLDSLDPVNLTFPLKQGDRYSHEITVIPNDSKFNYQTGIVHYSDGNYQIIDNSFTFRIPPNVLEFEAEMELEIEFQLEDLIRKSNRIGFVVLESLNSTDEIEFEDLTPVQELLKNLGQLIIDNENVNLEIIDTKSKLKKLKEDITYNENVRKKDEIKRQSNEKIRKDNETKRSKNESIREDNEEKRLESEAYRIKNEDNREQIFHKRVESIESLEKDIFKNESIRKLNEQERIKEEGSRLSNELLRKDNENNRKKNESIRVSEEKIRLENETDRIKNENLRDQKETYRNLEEKNREKNESIRIENEKNRNNAEKLRKENEEARISNEDNRVKAENLRLETFAKITKSLTDTEDYININEQKRMKNENLRLSQSKKVQEWIDNPELLRGPKGEQGTGLNILGTCQSINNLPEPTDSKPGDGYLIDGNLYVLTDEYKFINVGKVQGPKGEPGKTIEYISELINDEGFITLEDIPEFDLSEVDKKISKINISLNDVQNNISEIDKTKANSDHKHSNYLEEVIWTNIKDIPNTFNPSSHTHKSTDIKEVEDKFFINKAQIEKINAIDDKADDNDVVKSINGKKGNITIENNESRSSTIVIANHDSHENSKKGADIVIEKGENASEKINNAIQSLKGIGGEVKLMEGEYNLEYGLVINIPNVHLTGILGATVLKQNTKWSKDPINGDNSVVSTYGLEGSDIVSISNLTVKGANISGSRGYACYGLSQVTNCISNNSGGSGFYCTGLSQVTNCTSNNSGESGFYCTGLSQVTNCTSNNSGESGFYCFLFFKGICSYNVLKNDQLKDDSNQLAIVEYNIIQEEGE